MNKPLAETIAEDRRLCILLLLLQDTDHKLNSYVIKRALVGLYHREPMDTIKADCYWLHEQRLVTLEKPAGNLLLLGLTQRGKDIAQGLAIHPGVAEPELEL